MGIRNVRGQGKHASWSSFSQLTAPNRLVRWQSARRPTAFSKNACALGQRGCYYVVMSDVTRLLAAIEQGDTQAIGELLPLVYDELRRIARSHMLHERPGHTLQATALVHEAYFRMVGTNARWESRGHFFTAAAEAMRRILIDHARRKNAKKRGGEADQIEFEDDCLPIASPCDNVDDLIALDEALDRLTAEQPEKAALVKLLYFAGLNLEESATALGISRTTAYRHWLVARARLFDAMSGQSK
jgi:RNA polymerase sigma factor (TIGR02999 family)